MASKRARESGFSLLELIIVLMVMVSLLAIAWPNLQRPLRRTSLSEAAQTLRGAIDDSRYQAITTGMPMFVQLRQGDDVLRAGTFENFMNANDDFAANNSPAAMGLQSRSSSLQPATIKQPNNAAGQTALQAAIRTWTLPASVVISDVRWTLEPPSEEFSDDVAFDSAIDSAALASSGARASSSAAAVAEVQQSDFRDGGASRHTWWLPLVATGQGRDAAIVLFDTSINEEVTVTFASATGALEIVR